VPRAPVLFVAGYRDTSDSTNDHLRAAVADLLRCGALRVELGGLGRNDLCDLVRASVGASESDDVSSVADLLDVETAGNPLFAEQLLQHWTGSEQLALRDGEVRLSTPDLTEVPSTLRDLVWRRVNALGPEVHPVLTAAAVLGEQFEESVLAAMIGIGTRELGPMLDRAGASGVVSSDASQPGTSRFAHALVAHALVAEVGTRERTQLHGDAFAALLRVPAPQSARRSPMLAHHAEHSGLVAEAQRWATAAADDALANLAPDEAAVWFERALDHATTLGRPDATRADLLVRLGESRYRAGDPSALDTLHDGAALADQSGSDDVLLRAALAIDPGSMLRFGRFGSSQLAIAEAAMAKAGGRDLATRARVMALLAQSLIYSDQTQRRTEAANQALALARASGDPAVVARIAPDLLMALWAPGTAQLRSEIAAEALEIVEDLGDPSLSASLYYAAHTAAVCAGDADRASLCLDRLRAVAADVGEPRARWMAAVIEGFVATMAGRFEEAEGLITACFELGNEIGEPEAWTIFTSQSFVLGTFAGRHAELLPLVQGVIDSQQSVELTFRVAHAIVCVEVGQRDGPRALLRDAVANHFREVPADFSGTTALLGYAVLALELEDVDAAAMLLPEILPIAAEVSFNGITSQGPISAYAGKLLSLLDSYSDAEQHLLQALAVAESFGWEYHRATTLIALAQNCMRANSRLGRDGERWLATAEELCATHGINSWGARAVALREGQPAGP
jgi:tetratricopeptide (TPR) repeat protein